MAASFIWVSSVADPDPGSGAFLTPGSGMGKKSRSRSGMNILDHTSESLEYLISFEANADPKPWSGELFGPGSGLENTVGQSTFACEIKRHRFWYLILVYWSSKKQVEEDWKQVPRTKAQRRREKELRQSLEKKADRYILCVLSGFFIWTGKIQRYEGGSFY